MGWLQLVLMHSRYATPFGLTSEYAHPAEILFLGFATIFGPAITGPHLLTLWIWMSLRVLETVEAHCGYDFPWSLSRYMPIYGGYVTFKDLKQLCAYYLRPDVIWQFLSMSWNWGMLKLCLGHEQGGLSWLSPSATLHKIRKLLVHVYLHGLVSVSMLSLFQVMWSECYLSMRSEYINHSLFLHLKYFSATHMRPCAILVWEANI